MRTKEYKIEFERRIVNAKKLSNLFSTLYLDYREVKYWMTSLNIIIELANI